MDGVRLDRSIVIQLDDPDDTPSRTNGVSVQDEKRQRLHGVGLLHDAASVIQQPSSNIFRTASVILHRFFHQASLTQYDVWSVAMASLALACKVEDVKISFREIIVVFHHVYRKRILCLTDDPNILSQHACDEWSKSVSLSHKMELVQRSMTPLSPMGTIYKVWHNAMVEAEASILRKLGFILYWIPDSHPHVIMEEFCHNLPETVKRRAYEACDRTYYMDHCVRFDAKTIAYASVIVAAQWEHVEAPDCEEDCDLQAVSDICNWIHGMCDPSNVDMQVTRLCLIPSLIPEKSFTDPDSLSWAFVVDCMRQQQQASSNV